LTPAPLIRHLTNCPPWLLSGLCYGLAWPSFGNVPTGWLAWVALVPLLLRVRRADTANSFRRYVWATFPAFMVLPVIVCWWLTYYNPFALPLIWLTQSPCLYLPLACFYFLQRYMGWRQALWLLPPLWAGCEWVCLSLSPINLGVGNPAYTQANLLWVNQFADLTGMWGLTAWVIAMNVVVALAIDHFQQRQGTLAGRWAVAWPLARPLLFWLGVPVLYSLFVRYGLPSVAVQTTMPPLPVGIIQTNHDSYHPQPGRQLAELVRLGQQAVAMPNKPALVVAPEGASPLPLVADSALFAGVRQCVADWNVPLATGFMTPVGREAYYNEAYLFTPQLSQLYDTLHLQPADLGVYRKQHALAFSEQVPLVLSRALHWLGTPEERALQTGNKPLAFRFVDPLGYDRSLAFVICWDQMYPATVAHQVRQGIDFMAFLMNDGWFYDSPGPRQLLAFTQLRAIENRRGVVRSSNQGFSGYVDAFGRIDRQLPAHVATTQTVLVEPNTRLSLFTRYPNWFPVGCLLFTLTVLLYNVYRRTQSVPPFTPLYR